MRKYRILPSRPEIKDVVFWIEDATRQREIDVKLDLTESQRTPKIFDVPSTSGDIKGTEKAGDIAVDASYFYVVVDNSGTLEWRRVSISSF